MPDHLKSFECNTPHGTLHLYMHLSGDHPHKGRIVAVVQDETTRYPTRMEAEPVVINRIPVRVSYHLNAGPNDDLSLPESWRFAQCWLDRTDGKNATENQRSEILRTVLSIITTLFTDDPNLLYDVLRCTQSARVTELGGKLEEALQAVRRARVRLAEGELLLHEMDRMLRPFEGDDIADRMVYDEERRKVFGLGVSNK